MTIHHQVRETGILSVIASTYIQDEAKGRKAQSKAEWRQQNKTRYHVKYKHARSKGSCS